MRRLLFLSLLLPVVGYCDQSLHGYCAQTATLVLQSGGLTSSPQAIGAYPGCTVTVYYTGTTTIAPIFSDNGLTPLANPFTANTTTGAFLFYAANGRYDVNLSGGTPTPLPSAFTLSDYLLYDLPSILTTSGCLFSNGTSSGPVIFPGCVPGGPNASVQYNSFGSFAGSGNLSWNNAGQFLLINGLTGFTGLSVQNAAVSAGGGYISTYANINSFTGVNDGANLQAIRLGQNGTVNAGGYLHFTPITYNPYNQSATCKDSFGNPVQQPLNLTGDSNANVDLYLWSATSPLLPAAPTANCPTPGGPPLPVSPLVTVDGVPNQQWGLNTNGYLLARGGFATDNPAYNSIQSFFGGMYAALGFTTPEEYAMGPNATCAALNAVGGGYGGLAFQGGTTYCAWNASTSTWFAWTPGSGGGGGMGCNPGTTAAEVVVTTGSNNCTGYSTFTFNSSTNVLAIGGSGYVTDADGYVETGTNVYNAFQAVGTGGGCTSSAPCAGMIARSFSAVTYVQSGSFTGSAPTVTSGDTFAAGALAWSITNTCEAVFNGSTWPCISSGGGVGCTISSGTTGNIVYLASPATCGNSTNFTYVSGTVTLTGSGGSFETVGTANGFNASTCTAANCLQAPSGGGLFGLGVTAQAFYMTANPTPGFSPGAGDGGITYTGTAEVYNIWNGSTWANFNFATGGGTGCTLGATATGQIIFNLAGACTSTSALAWNNTTQLLSVTGTSATALAMNMSGFIETTGGFLTTSALTNAIQAPSGGVTALEGIFGGPNGNNPSTLVLIGTSGGSSQRAILEFDTPPSPSVTNLWALGTDPTSSGSQNLFLSSAGCSCFSMQFDYASGNIGIKTTALTATGQNLTVLGASSVSGITLVNGFMSSPGYLASSNAANAIQVTGTGGFSADNPGGGAVSGCAYAIGANCAIDTSRNGTFAALTATGNLTTNVTGLTQCLEVNSFGVVGGTGAACLSSGSFLPLAGGTMTGSIVLSSGAIINSAVTSHTLVYQAGGGNVQVFGDGIVDAINFNTSSNYNVNGAQSINNSNQFVGAGGVLVPGATVDGNLVIGQTIEAVASFSASGTAGVTCSGTPTSSFASKFGIVTHC